jgi:hypothetical protein
MDCPVCCQETERQKVHIEERLSFLEVWKRYFELHPKPKKVTFAHTAAFHPLIYKISTQTVNVCPVLDSDGLKICSYWPRMQPKSADPPKQIQVRQPWKQFLLRQSPSALHLDSADDKCEATPPDPKSSLENIDMDTSENMRTHDRL